MKKRIIYSLSFFVILLLKISIGMYVHDAFIRPYVGDALVVVLIYCFIRIFIPRSFRQLPVYLFVSACLIEILQYFQLADVMGVSENGLVRTMLGSTFEWNDIICYATASLTLLLIEYMERKIVKRRRYTQSLIGYKKRTHWYL